mgnify:CR=1 FL=1
MLTANPMHEYELKAALEFEFTRRGAERPAYGSIVGAGANATTLHYMRDSDPVKPGDLVVTLGAGDIWRVGEEILEHLRAGGR